MKIGLKFSVAAMVFAATIFGGCTNYTTRVDNTPGVQSHYIAPDTVAPIAGKGIESQDVTSMTDRMVRDMMANPLLVNTSRPPQVIVDAAYFRNESTNVINMNMITDRMRIGLNRAANGRMIFVGRHYSDMIEKERKLQAAGVTDQGTTSLSAKTLGGDYRLGGRITSLDAVSNASGFQMRYTQVVFEMVDLKTGAIVWGGEYSIEKADRDDVLYR